MRAPRFHFFIRLHRILLCLPFVIVWELFNVADRFHHAWAIDKNQSAHEAKQRRISDSWLLKPAWWAAEHVASRRLGGCSLSPINAALRHLAPGNDRTPLVGLPLGNSLFPSGLAAFGFHLATR